MEPVALSRADWRPPSRARVSGLRARLRAVYGIPVMAPHGDALAELVLTVLSQSTNDRNRDAAYLALRSAAHAVAWWRYRRGRTAGVWRQAASTKRWDAA